ncbi:MAG: aconitate hydratase [Deltaproteobacteria bacterium]|nr:aconitate hydratase [Deltaproteobacteria bacterium]
MKKTGPKNHVVETTPELVRTVYERIDSNLKIIRKRLGRPLTLAEKILLGHLEDPKGQALAPGKAILNLKVDRVALQDATAQMCLLQFMLAGRDRTAVPTTVHCDHLIRAHSGAREDMAVAMTENREVYEFLKTVSKKYGIGFWGPGAGIIHQVVLEQYAFPGGMMIGTDSHTPNAGGLGMIAIGVGGADAVDVMVGMSWEVLQPKLVGVKLTGELNGWTAPKDVILKVCEILTTKGGTNNIVEYFGPGARSLSATGKGTITNMGAELGATTSIFPYDQATRDYLVATQREKIASIADSCREILQADPEVEKNPGKFFDHLIEIDLSTLEPHIVGPHSPDLARPISKLKKDVREKNYPDTIKYALIGSCTNSSYEDIERAAEVARQAKELGLKTQIPLLITPGSEQVRATIERDGQMAILEEIGGTVLANACGPCIGQWKRDDIQKGDRNSILTSYNRNFPRRNDGNPETYAFIGSPEIVVAMSLVGNLSFDPLHDPLSTPSGKKIGLRPPRRADPLPKKGFIFSKVGYLPPAEEGQKIEVAIDPKSNRLQKLTPFPAWDGNDFEKLPVLAKAKGKCTTDHISPAGPWLKFRGHLDHISDNAFTGVHNAFSHEAGKGINILTGEKDHELPKIARYYKEKGERWVMVGDENYGEGSSREHAAMSPRFLGCAAVVTKSFARIHETNLKKQGILPLTFADPKDYEKIEATDRVSIRGLKALKPHKPLEMILYHQDGKEETLSVLHSMTETQLTWFKAGSALNALKSKA